MKVRITKPAKKGAIKAIDSKSMAHRLLIAAFLSGEGCNVIIKNRSADIRATQKCLDAIRNGGTLECGESGSTLRFMLPLAAALGAERDIIMSGRLPQRPIYPLDRELQAHGCRITRPEEDRLHIEGKLEPGLYELPGDVSSQYVTGLLLALPLLDGPSTLVIKGKLQSRPYVDMTLRALEMSGIKTEEEGSQDGTVFHIEGNRKYSLTGDVNVEGDWSNAAFWLCLGAMTGGPVTVTGLDMESAQGDKAVVSVLRDMGADISCKSDTLTVTAKALRGTVIDAGDIPDLVPVLAATAAAAGGETVIVNAGRLRLKESDRIMTTVETLKALGADAEETDDGLMVRGAGRLRGGDVRSFSDHRIAMMAAVAASLCDGEVLIDGSEAVNKSYPGFYEDYRSLGGELEELE